MDNNKHQKLSMDALNRISADDFKKIEKAPFVIVLDNIRSMNNVGSFFRTADAFALEAIYLCGITATPPNKEIHKTALGSTESVDWKYYKETTEAIAELKNQGFYVCAIEQVTQSVFLHEFNFQAHEKLAFVFGNEVFGVNEEVIDLCDECIEIPQIGTKHSLNVSISGGIVMWHAFAKWNEKREQ